MADEQETGPRVVYDQSVLSDFDLHLFNEGTHYRIFEKLGSHEREVNGVRGTSFAVWAPNAERVHVIGDFNSWDRTSHPLRARGSSGIWEGFIPGLGKGEVYKYFIESHHNGYKVEKADPFALMSEVPPKTASVVWDLEYEWQDQEWMRTRASRNAHGAPISIYELHIGSWMRVPEEHNRPLTYREMADHLVEYVRQLGFTHVEFMPIMEHPFYGSWGYQKTGFYAATSRYGTPQDLMYLIDRLHQGGIGVILDWVPSHFPTDIHGLGYFDGTHLFEHSDSRKGFHPDWKSLIFNYGRHEIRSFLIGSALFWLDAYHADGLRVDAVASMLYLDYSRKEGEWIPNKFGGRENIEAIDFLRRFNEEVYKHHPDVQTFAEESTAFAMVTRPTYAGGLGFGFKWDMGWMHDTLEYFAKDPLYRRYHQHNLTFRMIYAYSESYVLPLSHDEVVHGKGSLLAKMPGDPWQKFANLRILHASMFAQPGNKLLFMGGEIGQWNEWYHEASLDWHLLEFPQHSGIQKLVTDLNRLFVSEPALYELNHDPGGFEWIDFHDADHSVVSFVRKSNGAREMIVAVFNYTPQTTGAYTIGVPRGGYWREVLNTDSEIYGGSGKGNLGGQEAATPGVHGRPFSLTLTLPPLGACFFKNSL
jgi:1,4-alpha-glucan branching enzyme